MGNAESKITEKPSISFDIEKSFLSMGYSLVAGCDEAGRGPLCGPVVAAAVILPDGYFPIGLNDSKKLSEKKRSALYDEIVENAVSWSVAQASNDEIDFMNIREASMLAMNRAVHGLHVKPDIVLVDGNYVNGFDVDSKAVVHGDALSASIAAASVIAKVTRDRICCELDKMYPGYGIGKHKGYPTKEHYEALRILGASECHRKSFRLF